MMNTAASSLPPRRAASAVLLSLLGAGIGHIYAGRGRRGAVLLALSFAWAPVAMALAHASPATWVLHALIGLVLLTVAVTLFALVDSVRVARRAARPYPARPYNHAGLYLALVVLNALWFFGSAYVVRDRSFRAYKIPTESMAPGVRSGDRILVNMRERTPKRGDLIVFPSPEKPKVMFFKRVVGLPGEEITFEDGLVRVNGEPLPNTKVGELEYEETAGERTYRIRRDENGTQPPREWSPVQVPAGHVFVLGDHRSNAFDSRRFGTVPLSGLRGTAQYGFYPAGRARLLR